MKKAPWNIKDRKIKIAILGCGRIAKNHIEAIKGHTKDLDLVGIIDSSKKRVEEEGKKLNILGFTDIKECIEK